MRQRMKRWTSLLLAIMLAVTLYPVMPPQVEAAGERVEITWPSAPSSDGQFPNNLNAVPRVTSSPISVTATIENISDDQISGLYYEVTNLTTGRKEEITSTVAQKTGDFEVTFSNVALTEGLNKIVVKYGTTSVTESAPGWVYFTPTVELQDLKVNGNDFIDNEIYPDNPNMSTSLTITGHAPNATQVLAYQLNSQNPVSSYFNNGDFILIADDINNPNATANLRLTPGDNFLTFVARNNMRTYQTERNLIYDNGEPFAFDARITEQGETDSTLLVTEPTVNSTNVNLSAMLKVDTDALGSPAYQYVDVFVSGQSYGPFNLGGATPATRVNSVSPTTIYEGHGEIYLSIAGTSLSQVDDIAADDGVTLTDRDGAKVALSLNAAYSDDTVMLISIDDDLLETGEPYTLRVRSEGKVIHTETIQVVAPSPAFPTVNSFSITNPNDIREGENASDLPLQTIVFSTAVQDSDLSVRVVSLDGQRTIGSGTVLVAGSSATHTIELPGNMEEGHYKLQVRYGGNLLTELPFAVLEPLPETPVIEGVFETDPANVAAGAPTYFSVRGDHFGNSTADITSAALLDSGDNVVSALTPVIVTDDYMVLELPDQSDLAFGDTYTITFERNGITADYEADEIEPRDPADYDETTEPIVTNIESLGNGQLQFHEDETSRMMVMRGENFTEAHMQNTFVQIWLADGSVPAGANGTIRTDTIDAAEESVRVEFPNSLPAGDYLVSIQYNNDRVIGVFPITIANPRPSSYDVNSGVMTVYGSHLGNPGNAGLLRLKLVPHDEDMAEIGPINPIAGSLQGNRISYNLPSMVEGTYDIVLVYDGTELSNNIMTYTLTADADLVESGSWSQKSGGRYKVYHFNADLTIPSQRNQWVEFRFYNFASANSPTSTFLFYYVDDSLPYVEYMTLDGFRLSESVTNEVTEQPFHLRVKTNDKAEGVDIYFGEITNESVPYASSETMQGDEFVLPTVDGLDNGPIEVTVVPYRYNASDDKIENMSGARTYELNISSTPYVIIDNLYNGLVVNNEHQEITCGNTGSCVTGRFVNVPMDGNDFASDAEVRVEFNGSTVNLNSQMELYADGRFELRLTSFVEGSNKLKFEILLNNRKIADTEIEFFRFSTETPRIIDVEPVDEWEVPRFIEGSLPSSFVTTETNVIFRGQFANANSIQLTVRTTDEDGNPVVISDRRFGSNFNAREPVNNNPEFFDSITAANGQFLTNPLPLSTGDTVFEFTVRNNSNISVTRTITINREPQPYIIRSPRLVKNARGEDQANINKNFVMVEIEAEGADAVEIEGEFAATKQVTDSTGVTREVFYREVRDIRPNRAQDIDFTVYRGDQSIDGEFKVFNAGTPIEGAQFKQPISNRMRVFDNQIQLTFPRNTYLMRNDPTRVNQFITEDRQILFGIASTDDGRVDKYVHPAAEDGQLDNPNPIVSLEGRTLLQPPRYFRPASNLFWIDAGTIRDNADDMEEAYTGSGRLPYAQERFYARNEQDLVVPTNIGELTLRYDPYIVSQGWRYVTVFHFDIFEDHTGDVSYRWRNLGGVVDTRNNQITVPLERFGYYQVMYLNRSYDDVIAHDWGRHDLDAMISKGYMIAKESDRFVPNDPITRGEFATLLVKLFDIPLDYPESANEATFQDVPRYNIMNNGLYDFRYIETAARAGIVRGTTGGRFNPDRSITREEAAVMIARAANLRLNTNIDRVTRTLQSQFTDANLIDEYARSSVEAIARAGLITGKENIMLEGQNRSTYRFDPRATLTRAEAASISIRVLSMEGKLPRR